MVPKGALEMSAFKTCLFAAAAALSVITSSLAESQMEQVRSWLSQLAPELDKMTVGLSAGPNLTTCQASGDVQECTRSRLDDLSARTAHVRLFLDQNPAPKCLHNTETKVHQMIVMMETMLELSHNNFPGLADRRRVELMSDAIDQFGKDTAAQGRRDVLTCIFGAQRNYFLSN
jgi:hypothetical protein